MRAKLSSKSASELAKEEINRYAADAPNIAAAGAPRIDDDRLALLIEPDLAGRRELD